MAPDHEGARARARRWSAPGRQDDLHRGAARGRCASGARRCCVVGSLPSPELERDRTGRGRTCLSPLRDDRRMFRFRRTPRFTGHATSARLIVRLTGTADRSRGLHATWAAQCSYARGRAACTGGQGGVREKCSVAWQAWASVPESPFRINRLGPQVFCAGLQETSVQSSLSCLHPPGVESHPGELIAEGAAELGDLAKQAGLGTDAVVHVEQTLRAFSRAAGRLGPRGARTGCACRGAHAVAARAELCAHGREPHPGARRQATARAARRRVRQRCSHPAWSHASTRSCAAERIGTGRAVATVRAEPR